MSSGGSIVAELGTNLTKEWAVMGGGELACACGRRGSEQSGSDAWRGWQCSGVVQSVWARAMVALDGGMGARQAGAIR